MARRKKAKKVSHRRRRRVSGVALNAKSPLVQYGAIAAGFLMGGMINNAVANVLPSTLDPKIVAAAQVLGGYVIKSKVKGAAGAIAGGVLMGAGIKKATEAMNLSVINGLPTVSGYKDIRSINGLPRSVNNLQNSIPTQSIISGVDNYSAYADRD